MDCRHLFEGKKITILGLGLLGRAVGDAEFLAQQGAAVTVTDKKTEEELKESVERLKKYPNITFHLGGSSSTTALGFSKTEYRQENLGGHREEDFTGVDMVIKAAGVPLDSPEVALARANNVPVMMSTALFAKYASAAGAKIVGVTGTRGKSTTTHMIYETLKAAGKENLILGGNVRGISTLAQLPKVGPSSIAVLELDSWQLQGFGDLQISPHIAVFTNLLPDHQNYYPDMDAYFSDKANIFKFQHKGDTLIVGKSIEARVLESKPLNHPIIPDLLPADWHLKIPGDHNRENASLARAALQSLGLSEDQIFTGLESFEAVEGRLQFVRELSGMKIYNDNNATTPEATIAALKALGNDIALIIGGSEKGLPLHELVGEIKERASSVTLLVHDHYKGSERLARELEQQQIPFQKADSLASALRAARASGSNKVLFSPAFASFGMFKNEYDRNDQFMALVRSLS